MVCHLTRRPCRTCLQCKTVFLHCAERSWCELSACVWCFVPAIFAWFKLFFNGSHEQPGGLKRPVLCEWGGGCGVGFQNIHFRPITAFFLLVIRWVLQYAAVPKEGMITLAAWITLSLSKG